MRFNALACDYDGTLANNGHVSATTIAALQTWRDDGRRLILVTGRQMEELVGLFPEVSVFESVVAENGAVLYNPATRGLRTLVEAPPAVFVNALHKKGVAPLAIGHAIVATWKPHEEVILETIQELGLDLQVVLNKDAIMVLPVGVDKASGLKAAIAEMGLTLEQVVGVGDAENDAAFLSACGFSAAVSNALPAVQRLANMTTQADHGRGVEELIRYVLSTLDPVTDQKKPADSPG